MTNNANINIKEGADVVPFCTPTPTGRYAAFVETVFACMSNPIITCAECGGTDPDHLATHYLSVPCQCDHPDNI